MTMCVYCDCVFSFLPREWILWNILVVAIVGLLDLRSGAPQTSMFSIASMHDKISYIIAKFKEIKSKSAM